MTSQSNEHEEGEISESEKEEEFAMATESFGADGDVRNPKKSWKGNRKVEGLLLLVIVIKFYHNFSI